MIEIKSNKIFNLHGGDPERYRGLDSHLWSIYHNDFTALLTTLHRLVSKLDTGDIVAKCSIPITRNLPLYKLQAMNTEICIKLTLNLIDTFVKYGNIASRPQRKLGRYYSAMPKDLKTICFQKSLKILQKIFKMQHNENLPEKLTSFLNDDSFVIFLFHGVVSKSNYEIRNSNKKHMESNLFAKCMKILSERGRSFSMNDLLYFHTQKKIYLQKVLL